MSKCAGEKLGRENVLQLFFSGETDACLPDPDDKEDDVADLTMMMIRIKRYALLQ